MFGRSPYLLRKLFPELVWKINTTQKEIFLTFDDGPHPEITKQVLDLLDEYRAKATFFCVGENVIKHPDTYQEILSRGHQTGNHTFNHLIGWRTKDEVYFENIEKCAMVVDSNLFRPPHGRLSLSQMNHIKKQYQIIMWTVLTLDYNLNISVEKCLEGAKKSSNKGSIVVFHDSEKAARNMLGTLPNYLRHFTNEGYSFPLIPTK